MALEPRSGINPLTIIFLKIWVMGMAGIPIAYLIDRAGYKQQFALKLNDERFIGMAFVFLLYAVLIMTIGYYGLGFKRKILTYMKCPMVPISGTKLERIWLITFFLSALCFLVVFIQVGGQHPALQALRSDYPAIKILRREISQSINMNVFNLGFKLFLPFNLVVALFFLRKRRIFLIFSMILFIIMSTFLLEKSQVITFIFLVIFFRMLISPIHFKNVVLYILIGLILLSSMYFLTRFASNFSELGTNLTNRIMYGEISDLPVYLECFDVQKASVSSMLPPYLSELFGDKEAKSAARLVIESINPTAVSLGTAGVANTFFVGEAYAVAGLLGVILSPFLVLANLGVLIFLFSKIEKSIGIVFLFAWFLFKMFEGIFGGISYFVVSGIQLVLLALIYFLLIRAFARLSKRIREGSSA